MTIKFADVAPEYVSFYIAGALDVRIPLDHDLTGLIASDECINVMCLYWNEGDTKITLGPVEELPYRSEAPRFDGMLQTPEHKVILFDVNTPEILSMDVSETKTRVRIWTNHPTQPDDVVIGLG
ncbi:hypothetical protein [Aquamicrobium sp. LC103]|uniref:hypothetical protein n=1 Tax=Aquamicrobium sp. LC103 TaxID=1120658 RepID=UPI00063EBE3D|nr:hypothetical protein [Aquamicrobium sp. LC103]TKT80051.1 hypothetical protein XW59_006745 [Aquamicrobium sp. LC103]